MLSKIILTPKLSLRTNLQQLQHQQLQQFHLQQLQHQQLQHQQLFQLS